MIRKKLGLVLVLCLLTTACIHKASGPVTPMESISTHWAMFGQFLQTAEAGTQDLVTAKLITADQARPIIQFEVKVAQNQQALTPLIQQGQSAIVSSQALQTFLSSVQTDAAQLVALDVKNPKTSQTVTADIAFVVSISNLIIGDVNTLKGGN